MTSERTYAHAGCRGGTVSQRSATDRPRHRQARAHGAAAGKRLRDDGPARRRGPGSQPSSATHNFPGRRDHGYLKNGGTLEKVAAMGTYASTRTTPLYDRRRDELSLDEVERIVI